tara:strand:+ start:986 stop:1498 length:513 start_codon:yes stop_codon:yes gene_type:complete
MVALSDQPSFSAPVPGQSLTAELGARPWQNPPEYSTVDEAIEYYMQRMSAEDFMLQAADILEMGVPVTVLANTMQMSSVMEGLHTVDVGMMTLPLLMEMLMLIGDAAGIEYNTGLDRPTETRDSFLAKMVSKFQKEVEGVDLKSEREEDEEPIEMDVEDDEPVGLMARRR